jgi:hypothetical protein
MIVTYQVEIQGHKVDYEYDPETDSLNLGGEYEPAILVLDEQYFSLGKNNTIEIRKGIDDLADDFPEFFMRCLKERLKTMDIKIKYRTKPRNYFIIENNEDYDFFTLKFSDYIQHYTK